MARTVDEDELIEHWTLVGYKLVLLASKREPTRLGFALLPKFHTPWPVPQRPDRAAR